MRLMALAVGLVLTQAGTALAQAPAAAPPPAPEKTAVTAESPGGGVSQGIKVHGHWTIEVRDVDGRVVSHTEISNHLTPEGAQLLSALLARQASVLLWGVTVDGSQRTVGHPCVDKSAMPARERSCLVSEPSFDSTYGGHNSETLQVSVQTGGVLRLHGTGRAQRASIISSVATVVSSSAGGAPVTFTSASVNDIPVRQGQTIQVTVLISFS